MSGRYEPPPLRNGHLYPGCKEPLQPITGLCAACFRHYWLTGEGGRASETQHDPGTFPGDEPAPVKGQIALGEAES
jgi:hypothetical protein